LSDTDGFGHEAMEFDGWRVTLSPELRALPRDELLEIIERQANVIRLLKNKAKQRDALVTDLESQARLRNLRERDFSSLTSEVSDESHSTE
jgi:hypothetical protein